MSDPIKRYEYIIDDDGNWFLAQDADGEWMRYEDCEALEAENAELCESMLDNEGMRDFVGESKIEEQAERITALEAGNAKLTRSRDGWEADYGVMFKNNEDRKAERDQLKTELAEARGWQDLTNAFERTVVFRIAGADTDWTPTAMLLALQGIQTECDALEAAREIHGIKAADAGGEHKPAMTMRECMEAEECDADGEWIEACPLCGRANVHHHRCFTADGDVAT